MKRVFRNHVFLGLLSIFFGLLVSFVLTPMYSEAVEKKENVVRVKRKVTAGSRIEEKDLEVIGTGIYNMSDRIIRSKEELIGKYLRTDMYPGMYVVREAVSDTPVQKDLYLENIPEDKYAISVTVQNFAAGLSSKLLQGDVVSLIVKKQNADGMIECEVPDTLMYMEVLGATQEGGKDRTKISEDIEDKKSKNERLATVTLSANKYQIAELTSYEGEAMIHIALKSRNNEVEKLKFLTIQEEYFKELEASEYEEAGKREEEISEDAETKETERNLSRNEEIKEEKENNRKTEH